MTTRLGRWRWRCALCIEFGFTASKGAAESEFYRHYYTRHHKGDR